MAVMKIARKDSSYVVVCNAPDMCWTPGVPAPVPYPIIDKLGSSKGVAKKVKLNGKPAFVHSASRTDGVKGDQPGKAGVATGVVGKPAFSLRHSSTVKIGGKYIVRTGDQFWMNNTASGEPRNKSVQTKPNKCNCGAPAVGAPVNPVLGIKVLPTETDFQFDGPLPLNWGRVYASDQEGNGWLGQGWSVFYSTRLLRKKNKFVFIDQEGREFDFPFMEEHEEAVYLESEQLWFSRLDNGKYEVSTLDGGIRLWFAPIDTNLEDPKGEEGNYLPLVAVMDRNGFTQRLVYDHQTKMPKELIDCTGRVIQLHFHNILSTTNQADQSVALPIYRLTEITWLSSDPKNISNLKNIAPRKGKLLVKYGYDKHGDLISVENADGVKVREFAYRYHVMVMHKNAAGLISQYEYNDYSKNGKVVHNYTNLDEHWYFDYKHNHTVVTDPLGRKETYYFDHNQELVKHIHYDGTATETERDDFGRPLVQRDQLGREIRYTYNIEGQVISIANAHGVIKTFNYDTETFLLTEVMDAHGNTTSYTYDEIGNIQTVTDAKSNVTKYSYNDNGLPISIENAKGGENTFTYNHLYQLTQLTDCSQKNTQVQYDPKGNIQTVINALGDRTYYQYNNHSQLTDVRYSDGSTEHYEYDAAGRLVEHIDGLGHKTQYQLTVDGLPVTRTNALGDIFKYQYDLARRLKTLVNENGDQYHFGYDIVDNLIKEIGWDGKTTAYHYNLAGELVQENLYGQVSQPEVDLSKINALIKKVYQRDDLGRLIQKTAYDLGSAEEQNSFFKYNELGQIIRAENDDSHIQIDYNELRQLIQERTYYKEIPELVNEVLLNPVDAKTVQYQYDQLGNRISMRLPTGQDINYLYYGSGHLHQINVDGKLISDFERDDLHREISRTQGGLTSYFDLDPMGRIKQQLATAKTDLDPRNKMQWMVASGPVKRSYQYDKAGNLSRSYDQRSQQTLEYVYDKIGRITQAGEEIFTFDPAHNIIDSGEDLVQNKKTTKDQDYYKQMMADPSWSPLKDDPKASPIDKNANRVQIYNDITYHYDELGNLILKEEKNKILALSYNSDQQLVKAHITRKDPKTDKELNSETWCYTYDVFGRRMKKERLGKLANGHPEIAPLQTSFVWDGAKLLQEETEKRSYIYLYREGSFEPLAQLIIEDQEEPQINYLHTDQSGLPKELTNEDGELIWYAKYKTWGRVEEENNLHQAHQPLRFQNQYYDQETGLHYNLMRYYEPDVGRFVNQDPIGVSGGLNLYNYSLNPFMWIDPLGLADFYVSPNGTAVPATAYRYMRHLNDDGSVNKYAQMALDTKEGKVTYFGFEKLDTKAEVLDKFQISPEWSDGGLRCSFDTLQLADENGNFQARVPFSEGDTNKNLLEPITKAYPQYGNGGAVQLHADLATIKFDTVSILK